MSVKEVIYRLDSLINIYPQSALYIYQTNFDAISKEKHSIDHPKGNLKTASPYTKGIKVMVNKLRADRSNNKITNCNNRSVLLHIK